MSERTEVEVLLPLAHRPSRAEQRALMRVAFREANEMVRPGRVLGVVGVMTAVHMDTGAPALKVRFAVEVPEESQPQRTTFATS